jgi:hypothetical protein
MNAWRLCSPTRQFLDVLNEAVNHGVLGRSAAGPEYTCVTADATRDLVVPTAVPIAAPNLKPVAGAIETTELGLDLKQSQDSVEEGALALTKMLAGTTPGFAMKIKLKGKTPPNIAGANTVLGTIKSDWKFGV